MNCRKLNVINLIGLFILIQVCLFLEVYSQQLQWTIQSSGTSFNLTGVYFLDSLKGFVIGNHGILLKTSNGGSVWAAVNVHTNANLNSIQFPSSTSGWIVGDSSTILKTTNGGFDWVRVQPESTANFYDVQFRNIDTGWICGSHGTMLRTINRGNNWSLSYLPMHKTLRSMGYFSSNSVQVIGSDGSLGVLFQSTNDGESWDWANDIAGGYYGLRWLTSTVGYLTGGKIMPHGGYYSYFTLQLPSFFELDGGYVWYGFVMKKNTYAWAYKGDSLRFRTENNLDWTEVHPSLPGGTAIFPIGKKGLYVVGRNGLIGRGMFPPFEISDTQYFMPKTFQLFQNTPNPFNPRTTIKYSLPKMLHVSLKVYDVLGREVLVAVDEVQEAGNQSVEIRAENLQSGIYLYRIQAGAFLDVKKMILIK